MSLLEHFHKAVRRVLPSCGLAGSEEIGDRFGEIGLADLTKTPRTFTEMVEKDHGRLEVRCCFAFDQLDALHKPEQWVSLGFFVVFESERTLKGKTTLEQRLYITSLPADAARISAAIRAHGSVENRLHQCMDVVFGDDQMRTRVGHAAHNFAELKHITLKLIRLDPIKRKGGIKARRLVAVTSGRYRAELFGFV